MDQLFAFEELEVYQIARQYVKNVYLLSEAFPAKEDFALTSQIRRAAVSITSNLAEGTSRFSLRTIRPLGELLTMVSEKLSALSLRKGKHIEISALP